MGVEIRIRYVSLALIVVNIIVFVLQLILGDWFTNMFLLSSADIISRPWIVVTSMFLHEPHGATHLLFNMFSLFMFGPLLESRIGSKRFTILYFLSGIVGGILYSVITPGNALGASAAIMGVLGMTIIILPDLPVLFFFVIPMRLWVAGVIFILIDLFGLIPGVAHVAHLGGVGTGLLYGWFLKRMKGRAQRVVERPKKGGIHMSADEFEDYLKSGRI